MRKTITTIALSVILFACSQHSTSYKKKPSDTARVVAVYNLKCLRADTIFRVTKDTFRLSNIDTSAGNARMRWQRDTTYFIPVLVDTPKKVWQLFAVPPQFAQEVTVKTLK